LKEGVDDEKEKEIVVILVVMGSLKKAAWL
jgi:hypothetical protein